jgi:apolipoprotein N-acyltransferase
MKITWQNILMGMGLSLLSGLLLTAAFPPYELWPLAFVALVPMLVAQYRYFPRAWSGLAFALGIGGFFLFFMALGGLIPFLVWLPAPVAVIAGLVGWRERVFNERTGARFFWLVGPLLWVGFEMLRGLVPFFGTWGFPAYTLYSLPWLIQPVTVFSIYGLDLLIVMVNYTLALGVLVGFEHLGVGAQPKLFQGVNLRRVGLGVSSALLGWIILSLALFQPQAGTLSVAAIHPGMQVRSAEDDFRLGLLYDATRMAAQRGAQLVVWNEGALPFDPQQTHTQALQALAAESEAYLSIGYLVETNAGLRNEATLLAPDGDFLSVFGKDHPVLLSGETSLTGGANYDPARTSIGAVGTVICYDIDFTDTTRKVARAGAQVIAVPSFDWPEVASVHYTHMVFRAVENRVSMIKADVGFDSAIVDPYGRILQRVVTPQAGVFAILTADVPLGTGNTLVMRLGDWVGWIALVATGGFILTDIGMSVVRSRRENSKNRY